MYKEIKYHLSIAFCSYRLSLQKQFEYPMVIITCFIMIPLMYGSGVLLLYFMVKNFNSLAGWTFPQLIFLYGLGYLSHGLMMVFSVQSWWIGTYAVNGEFDRMLLQPANVFFLFSIKHINFIGLMDVLVGASIFLYSCTLAEIDRTVPNILKILLVIFGATLIRSSIFTIFCSTAFWTKRSESVVTLMNDLLEKATMYPLSIYPDVIQFLFTFLIPIAFISYYPACDLLGVDGGLVIPFDISLFIVLIGIILFILSCLIFDYGLRSYDSAGS